MGAVANSGRGSRAASRSGVRSRSRHVDPRHAKLCLGHRLFARFNNTSVRPGNPPIGIVIFVQCVNRRSHARSRSCAGKTDARSSARHRPSVAWALKAITLKAVGAAAPENAHLGRKSAQGTGLLCFEKLSGLWIFGVVALSGNMIPRPRRFIYLVHSIPSWDDGVVIKSCRNNTTKM